MPQSSLYARVPIGVQRPRRALLELVQFYKAAADGSAAGTTSVGILRAEYPLRVVIARFIPHSTLTANDTNYATIALKVGTAVKASQTTKTTGGGGSGDFVLNTPVALTNGAINLATGDVLLFDIAKAGTGVVVPAGVLSAYIESVTP